MVILDFYCMGVWVVVLIVLGVLVCWCVDCGSGWCGVVVGGVCVLVLVCYGFVCIWDLVCLVVGWWRILLLCSCFGSCCSVCSCYRCLWIGVFGVCEIVMSFFRYFEICCWIICFWLRSGYEWWMGMYICYLLGWLGILFVWFCICLSWLEFLIGWVVLGGRRNCWWVFVFFWKLVSCKVVFVGWWWGVGWFIC